jgi:hypothetical protein
MNYSFLIFVFYLFTEGSLNLKPIYLTAAQVGEVESVG